MVERMEMKMAEGSETSGVDIILGTMSWYTRDHQSKDSDKK